MPRDKRDWKFLERVTRPALIAAPASYLDDIAACLAEAGIQAAVAARATAPIFDWLMPLISLQGISDVIALDYDARHGGVTFAGVQAALHGQPSRPRPRCHWSFDACSYRKGAGPCIEPAHQSRCPLPHHPLRKGNLNVAAYGLALFFRDVCEGDFVAWI